MICLRCASFSRDKRNQYFLVVGCLKRKLRFGLMSDLYAQKDDKERGIVAAPNKCDSLEVVR